MKSNKLLTLGAVEAERRERGDTAALLRDLDDREAKSGADSVWISRLTPVQREGFARNDVAAEAPLAGAPFAIKDNIDLAGCRTTAGCPAFNSEPAKSNAFVVERLIGAGAIPLGKTNLDQFATGLVGVRSPYGTPPNPFDARYIPGGSSSGSAVAVAMNRCAFALGTDTAGSGRVPASMNGLVGYKPTKGLLSTRGVLPACRTLDCVSIFAHSVGDAARVASVAIGYDSEDPFSRRCPPTIHRAPKAPRIGVPGGDELDFFGDSETALLWGMTLERLRALGADVVSIDYRPFREAAELLYQGPWVAERYLAVGSFIDANPEKVHPVTRQIISGGRELTAAAAFAAQERLAALRAACDTTWQSVDAMLTPTIGTVYTLAELEADPIRLNSNLGRYTNHFNLLDLCGLAIPAGSVRGGVPWGVTLSAPAFRDDVLFDLGARFFGESSPPPALVAEARQVDVVVCGAHLSGFPLNGDLVRLGARLVRRTRTAARYRMHVLEGTVPPKPGLVRVNSGGAAIAIEVWRMPVANYGVFVASIPSPLGIGTVEIEDGSCAQGFICEAAAVQGMPDISGYGGWAAWVSARAK